MEQHDQNEARIPPRGKPVNVYNSNVQADRDELDRAMAYDILRKSPGLVRWMAIAVLVVTMFVVSIRAVAQPLPSERIYLAHYISCAGWGLCTFRLEKPDPLLGHFVQVRMRGIGDPALAGSCDPERDGARTVREFVQGILVRAVRIELARVEQRPTGSVLATVLVDGTDTTDIVAHIGFGRGLRMAPDASWCD